MHHQHHNSRAMIRLAQVDALTGQSRCGGGTDIGAGRFSVMRQAFDGGWRS